MGLLGAIFGILGDLGQYVGHLGAILVPTWRQTGAQDAFRGCFLLLRDRKSLKKQWFSMIFCLRNGASEGTILEPSWGHLGASWGHLGAILGRLGASCGHFAAIFGPSWGLSGPTSAHLWAVWPQSGPKWLPRSPNEGPKVAQDCPEMIHGRPTLTPGRLHEGLKTAPKGPLQGSIKISSLSVLCSSSNVM